MAEMMERGCSCRRCNGSYYRVKRGDTIYFISRNYDVPIQEIRRANPGINVFNLEVGSRLCIPMYRPYMPPPPPPPGFGPWGNRR